jgi:hypothetical protein
MDIDCASRRLGLQYRCGRETVTGSGILVTHHDWKRRDSEIPFSWMDIGRGRSIIGAGITIKGDL